MNFSTASLVCPVRFWMRPSSYSSLPSAWSRSSSVSSPHCCFNFPLAMCQFPLISSLFMDLVGLIWRLVLQLSVTGIPYHAACQPQAAAKPRVQKASYDHVGRILGRICTGDCTMRCNSKDGAGLLKIPCK